MKRRSNHHAQGHLTEKLRKCHPEIEAVINLDRLMSPPEKLQLLRKTHQKKRSSQKLRPNPYKT